MKFVAKFKCKFPTCDWAWCIIVLLFYEHCKLSMIVILASKSFVGTQLSKILFSCKIIKSDLIYCCLQGCFSAAVPKSSFSLFFPFLRGWGGTLLIDSYKCQGMYTRDRSKKTVLDPFTIIQEFEDLICMGKELNDCSSHHE